ncbi:MAG: hypothetical protein HS108_10440 [Planctomycetes bacterium]|jgi:3-hydroxyacyl-[acyl-carrier-protein] dehydratase|nr:hypothetical protein [Planctomycetota bacterium]MCL4730245.1 hypothetical protein [Planctomycetota bacterium]
MNLQQTLRRALQNVAADAAGARAELRFAGDEFFFEGHFPGAPVLPAVVQVGAAVELASRVLNMPQRLVEVTRAKFTSPTGPGRVLTLVVTLDAENGRHRVRASMHDGETPVSEFTLRVEKA